MMRILRVCSYWVGFFLYYATIVLAIGTVAGACLFPLLGPLFVDLPLLALMKKGVWMGFRYAGVWAGGIAITLCFFKGGRRRAS